MENREEELEIVAETILDSTLELVQGTNSVSKTLYKTFVYIDKNQLYARCGSEKYIPITRLKKVVISDLAESLKSL